VADELSIREEADRIGRYLLGEAPTRGEQELYLQANETLGIRLIPYEEALLRTALSGPFMAGLIDGGLALTDPASMIRKKFFIMLAILEASPEHSRRFLSEGYGPAGFVALGARVVAAGIKGTLGVLFLALFRLKLALWK
jgi:hypothetical protein